MRRVQGSHGSFETQLGRWRRTSGNAEHDDLAEVIAIDLQAVTAGRAGHNGVGLAPLPRRAGRNGDVAVALLATEWHAIRPIQLMSAHHNFPGVCRRHHDQPVYPGEPLSLSGKE